MTTAQEVASRQRRGKGEGAGTIKEGKNGGVRLCLRENRELTEGKTVAIHGDKQKKGHDKRTESKRQTLNPKR